MLLDIYSPHIGPLDTEPTAPRRVDTACLHPSTVYGSATRASDEASERL